MKPLQKAAAAAVLALTALPVIAQPPAFDPRSWRGQHIGQPTQVLTIGSAHLSELKVPLTAAMFTPLLDRLARFNPQIITVEGISGEQCDTLRRYAVRYPESFDTYCRATDEALNATGLDIPAATGEVQRLLNDWPAQPTAAQRRHLAAVMLASGDRPSAQVQWLRLPLTERRTGDGVDDALLKILLRADVSHNETFDVAVPLAVRLGLERIYLVDDHTSDAVEAQAGPGFGPAIKQIWATSVIPEAKEYNKLTAAITDGAGVLAQYRYVNLPKVQRAFITGDYHWALGTASTKQYGRQYVAWWETRNLRMVANIRAAFGNHPGARVLNIVGASHKPYYDAYLGMMSDVKLVDASAALK